MASPFLLVNRETKHPHQLTPVPAGPQNLQIVSPFEPLMVGGVFFCFLCSVLTTVLRLCFTTLKGGEAGKDLLLLIKGAISLAAV